MQSDGIATPREPLLHVFRSAGCIGDAGFASTAAMTLEAAHRPMVAAYWAAVAQTTLATLPLLLPRGFYYDWTYHVWFASYVAGGLLADLRIPLFLNLEEQIGNPTVLFYGSGSTRRCRRW